MERILLCSGKIYYELEQNREELKRTNVALLRVEQLYPLPRDLLRKTLADYRDGTPVYWVQEEPENMGAWRFLRVNLRRTPLRSPSICRHLPRKAPPAPPPAAKAAT